MKLMHVFPIAILMACASAPLVAAEGAALRVATVPVAQARAGATQVLEAVLEPVQQATVAAQTGGNVLALRVKAGDTVRRGQPLVQLDDRDSRANTARSDAQVAQAEAELRNVQQVLERNQQLKKSGFISAAALDSAENQVKSAQAALRQAQAARAQAAVAQGFAELAAPFDGIVLATHVQGGDLALPGRALLTLYQPGRMRAVAQVPASLVGWISGASEVRVLLPNGEALVPIAREMQPTADPVSQTVEWRLPLPSSAQGLRPGQMVQVQASSAGSAAAAGAGQRLVVPQASMLHRGELTAVYVALADGFALRAVRLGERHGDMVEVLAGLRAGERVALDPVRAGMPGARAQ